MRLRLITLVVVAAITSAALGAALASIVQRSQSNCEATLVFAQAMEAAIQPPTPESTAFFKDVYSKLDC